MSWRASIVALILLAAAPAAHAAEVTTYGTGLMSCEAYLNARETDAADDVNFIDWLVGYLSGVNATSTRRNNVLGAADVREAMERLENLCQARPHVQFAAAAGVLITAGSATPGAHSVNVTQYGFGFKSCETYIEARDPQSIDRTEFIDWLGGYLSGVNAISLKTNDILGGSDLAQAVYWLDSYCDANPSQPVAMAAATLVTEQLRNVIAASTR